MDNAEFFYYNNAGFSYDLATETPEQGRTRTARDLAKAEVAACVRGWFVSWEADFEPWDGYEPYEGPLWAAVLYDRDGDALASLGGIACDGQASDYGRVVDAELADEALERLGE